MHVTACVVSYGTAAHLPGALDALLAQTHPDLHVLVVDNASADGSADLARRHADVEVIANDRNLGYTGAANQGVARAREALLLLTPDVRLDPGHVAALVAALRAHPRASSAQGRLHRVDAAGRLLRAPGGRPVLDSAGHSAHRNRVFGNRGEGQPDDGRVDAPAEVFGTCGAAVLHRLDALHDVAVDGEVFDDDLFAFYEDVDLDWRLKARGWQARYVPEALATHERGGEGARRSRLVERLSYRNRFLVIAKNDDLGSLLPDLPAVGATTVLKTADLVLTVPTAFLRSLGDAGLLRSALARRRVAERRRTVANAEVVARWFESFDYRDWVRKRAARGW
jgi:GT2 family glycosyltransferase